MVIFGLILLLLALAVIAYMWFATAGMTEVGIDYGFLNADVLPFWLFVAGGITLAVATCGLWMMAMGTRSKARRAKEVRELRRQAKDADRRADRAHSTAPRGAGARATDPRDTDVRGDGSRGDGPILPRPGRTEGPGTTSHSSLDVDR